MKQLDMMGQPCPIPVVKAKEALREPGAEGVRVFVDNIVAVQNLEKMAKGLGYGFSYTQKGESEWAAVIIRDAAAPPPPAESAPAPIAKAAASPCAPTVLITSDAMGRGADELGKILIKGFIFSLTQLPVLPENVIFLNGGARLTTEGANTLDDLRTLAAQGVHIYTCGTCLNYYGLTEKLAVGEITDMMGITSRVAAAGHMITI